jgi:hypothetical protein
MACWQLIGASSDFLSLLTTRDLGTDDFDSPLDDGPSPKVDWVSFGGGEGARDRAGTCLLLVGCRDRLEGAELAALWAVEAVG